MSTKKTVYGRGWNPIDITGPLGEVEVLIELVVEEMKERGMEDSAIDLLRENLEELSANYTEFMDGVADYVGDEYGFYTSLKDYEEAEKKWSEYKAYDVVMD